MVLLTNAMAEEKHLYCVFAFWVALLLRSCAELVALILLMRKYIAVPTFVWIIG